MGVRDFLKRRFLPEGRSSGADAGALPTEPDADGFRAVGRSTQIRPGRSGTFQVGGEAVALFRAEGGLYAIGNACAHEDGPLGEGSLSGCFVTCPYHDWRFDVRTGACITDPSRAVASYAVKEADGILWVGKKLREGTEDRGGEHNDGLSAR